MEQKTIYRTTKGTKADERETQIGTRTKLFCCFFCGGKSVKRESQMNRYIGVLFTKYTICKKKQKTTKKEGMKDRRESIDRKEDRERECVCGRVREWCRER